MKSAVLSVCSCEKIYGLLVWEVVCDFVDGERQNNFLYECVVKIPIIFTLAPLIIIITLFPLLSAAQRL